MSLQATKSTWQGVVKEMTIGIVAVLALAVRTPLVGCVTDALFEIWFRRFGMRVVNRKIGRFFFTPSPPLIFFTYNADKFLRSHNFLQICLDNVSPLSNVVFCECIPGLG